MGGTPAPYSCASIKTEIIIESCTPNGALGGSIVISGPDGPSIIIVGPGEAVDGRIRWRHVTQCGDDPAYVVYRPPSTGGYRATVTVRKLCCDACDCCDVGTCPPDHACPYSNSNPFTADP